MANKNSSPRTVADNVRSSVSSRLNQSQTTANVKPLVQQITALPAQERASRLLKASVAMYRATTDKNFSPSQNQINDYKAAVDIIAAKRGINPDKKGNFSKDQLDKELAPKELMKNFASDVLASSSDEQSGRDQIEQDINTAYENSAVPQEISNFKNIPAHKTDEEIMSLTDEDELKNYMEFLDPVEHERISKLLDKKNNPKDISEKDVGMFDRLTRDPDWGHKKDDDNFKIEQGDIIDYLMKEVILASAAWAGNKAAGFVGIVGYEMSSAAYHNVLQPGWKKLKEKLFNREEQDSSQQGTPPPSNNQPNSPTPNNPTPSNTNQQIFNNFVNAYTTNTNTHQRRIEALISNDPRKETLFHYMERLVTNNAVIGDDKIIELGSSSKPFNEISSTVDIKNQLLNFRENIREEQFAYLNKQFPNREPEIRSWFVQQTEYEEDYIKTNGKPTKTKTKNKEFSDALDTIRTRQLKNLEMLPAERQLLAQKDLFAEHYGAYKFLELSRLDPNNTALSNAQEYQAFMKKSQCEASYIFLKLEQQRRQGQDVPSRESLIKTAEEMASSSKQRGEQGNKQPLEDKILTIYSGKTNIQESENQTLLSEYKNLDPGEKYAGAMFNLDLLTKELGQTNQDIEKRRTLLNNIKKSIKTKSPDKQDISNLYKSRGGRN